MNLAWIIQNKRVRFLTVSLLITGLLSFLMFSPYGGELLWNLSLPVVSLYRWVTLHITHLNSRHTVLIKSPRVIAIGNTPKLRTETSAAYPLPKDWKGKLPIALWLPEYATPHQFMGTLIPTRSFVKILVPKSTNPRAQA